MRFKAAIQNINTFTSMSDAHVFTTPSLRVPEFTASLASLGPVAWVRLNENEVRFTIIPEQGTQVWAQVSCPQLSSACLLTYYVVFSQ